MIEEIKTESEAQWLELRAANINSTDTAALFGLSPYTTELELYHQKKEGVVVRIDDNDRMLAGRCLEAGIAEMVSHKLACSVAPYKNYVRDTEARIGSSFDFVITSGEYKDWILEIKNVDYLVYRDKWSEDEAPEHIEVQVQHQLELTQRPGALIAALVGGNDLKLIMRERNARAGAGIRKRIERFWRDVEAGNEPEIDYQRDADFLIEQRRYSDASKSYDATQDTHVKNLLLQYQSFKDAIKTLESKAKAVKAEVLTQVDDAAKVYADGAYVNCSMRKDTPGKSLLITEDMVGQEIQLSQPRKGFRDFRVTLDKKAD